MNIVCNCTLAVGIPTYNRPSAMERRLSELTQFSQLIKEIIICDNSSESPLELQQKIKSISNCRYYKNPVNIGGGANFLRIIENATTDYIWWRGDDDVISSNQIEAVANNLSLTPRLVLISNGVKKVFSGKGIQEFVDNFDKVQTMGWISSIVLPVNIAKKSLPWGYAGIASGWANVALILGLFRVCPELDFIVVPIILKEGEFRDVGRDGLRWALFNTCIKQFPMTANVLPNNKLKNTYIKNWRKTHSFSLIKTMFRLRLGFMRKEEISFSTLAPLWGWSNPKSSLLMIVLLIMSKIPKVYYQIIFAGVWQFLRDELKLQLDLTFIPVEAGFIEAFRAIRKGSSTETAGVFI